MITPDNAIKLLEDDYSMELAEPEAMLVLRRAAIYAKEKIDGLFAVTYKITGSHATIEWTGEAWAVREGGNRLSQSGEWSYEPMPSNRTCDYCERHAFDTREDALAAYRKDALV